MEYVLIASVREDIARLYASFQFILAPTFKTFLDIMEFFKGRAGVMERNDKDKSPRRPLTAVRRFNMTVVYF